jgi:hypothetical protein
MEKRRLTAWLLEEKRVEIDLLRVMVSEDLNFETSVKRLGILIGGDWYRGRDRM